MRLKGQYRVDAPASRRAPRQCRGQFARGMVIIHQHRRSFPDGSSRVPGSGATPWNEASADWMALTDTPRSCTADRSQCVQYVVATRHVEHDLEWRRIRHVHIEARRHRLLADITARTSASSAVP